MEKLLSIVVLALDILALVHIWKGKSDTLKKIIWSLVIICLPVAGFIIWYFIGPKATAKLLDVVNKPS